MSAVDQAVENQKQMKPGVSRSNARLVLISTSILFVLWVGAMIAMYVLTVYPLRYPKSHSVPPSAGRTEMQNTVP